MYGAWVDGVGGVWIAIGLAAFVGSLVALLGWLLGRRKPGARLINAVKETIDEDVKILGSGCANCRKLEAVAREAASSSGVEAISSRSAI